LGDEQQRGQDGVGAWENLQAAAIMGSCVRRRHRGFGGVVTYCVRIVGMGLQFGAAPGETLLAAARAQGVALASSCRNGTCRECRCRVVEGHAHHIIAWPGLSAEEKQQGWILPCVAVADSDLVIEPRPR
jgi:ferredoxin